MDYSIYISLVPIALFLCGIFFKLCSISESIKENRDMIDRNHTSTIKMVENRLSAGIRSNDKVVFSADALEKRVSTIAKLNKELDTPLPTFTASDIDRTAKLRIVSFDNAKSILLLSKLKKELKETEIFYVINNNCNSRDAHNILREKEKAVDAALYRLIKDI